MQVGAGRTGLLTTSTATRIDEAIVGLAKRGDPRGLAVLIEDYEDGWEGPTIDEAGEFYVEAVALESRPPPGY